MAMPELERLLRKMIEGGASDLHLLVGRPPLLRTRGELVPMDEPPLTRESSEAIITERRRSSTAFSSLNSGMP